MGLGARQREALERLLERERDKLVRRLRRFGEDLGAADSMGLSQHMAEHATAMTERERAFLMASEEGRRLVRVNQALERLVRDPSGFGDCRGCGTNIGFDRLEAIPYAELCIHCKREEEELGSRSGE